MSDELDEVKRLFRAEAAIVPRAAAQQDAIAAAMQRFEQENLRASQGLTDGNRLKRWVWAVKRTLKGFSMPSLRMNQALLAGTSLTVLTIVVVSSSLLREQTSQLGEADKISSVPV